MKYNKLKGACIYKIQHKTKSELLYIGSTINLSRRRCTHKNNSDNLNINSKLFQLIRANGGWSQFDCNILIKVKCNNFAELRKKENEVIQVLQPSMNSKNAVNLISRSDYNKKYREINKDKLIKYQIQYRQLCKNKLNLAKELYNESLLNEIENEIEQEDTEPSEPEEKMEKMELDPDNEELYDIYDDVQFLEDVSNDDNLMINDFIRELFIDVIIRNNKRTTKDL